MRALRIFGWLGLLLCSANALAMEFRSVAGPVAILYDAPSLKGKKLYLVKAQTPVEVVVKVEGWVKLRDAEGSLAWMESRLLSERRMVVAIAPRAAMRASAQADAPVVAELDKWVAVEWLEAAGPGWAKVRHADGTTGFVRSTQVWGL